MATIDESKNEIHIKLVFWGPPSSGKTTNLKFIHKKLSPSQRGELINCKMGDDEALFFDFTPLNIGDVYGKTAVFHLYALPGEIESIQSKKALLSGADGILFVADSSPEALEGNAKSMKELRQGLESLGIEPDDLPITLQLNKRDIEGAASEEEIKETLRSPDCPSFEATAIDGKGVLDSFTNVSKLSLRKVKSDPAPKSEEEAVGESAGPPENQPATTENEREKTGETTPPVKVPLDDALSQYAFDEKETEFSGEEESIESTKVTEETPLSVAPDEEKTESLDAVDLPEGIEMEPGFEPEGEEGLELSGSDEASVEVEDYGEEITSYAEEEAEESLENMAIPEGIEMEPGFEPEGEERLELSGSDEASVEVEDYGEEITSYAKEETEESLENAALPEGIERSPGFEPEGEEGLESDDGGEESISVEDYGEDITSCAEEETEESLEEVTLPEGIETEPGFEPDEKVEEGIDIPDDIGSGEDFELEQGGLTPPAKVEMGTGVETDEGISLTNDIEEPVEAEDKGEQFSSCAIEEESVESSEVSEPEETAEVQPPIEVEPLQPSVGERNSEEIAKEEQEGKITFGRPQGIGGGQISIPLTLHSGSSSKRYNLKLSLTAEGLSTQEGEQEKIEGYPFFTPPTADNKGMVEENLTAGADEGAAFSGELGEEFSSEESEEGETSGTWKTGIEETILPKKKGFFARLFGK